MLTVRQGIRPLAEADLDAFLALTSRDPVVNVFAEYRARSTRLDPRALGGEVWGRFVEGELVSACHVGANLVPVQASPEDARLFAERALESRRSSATLVGPQAEVAAFWEVVRPLWGAAREERWDQPHLQIAGSPEVRPDPAVRRTHRGDLRPLYPACVAMYTEEVGVSPEDNGGARLYRARVQQLISRGWSFARIEDGEVLFKAEVAWATPRAAQIQGVYVAPEHRGEGLAAAGMAAVVEAVRRDIAPVVSLYVNEWNTPARRTYERVGFTESARFATIML